MTEKAFSNIIFVCRLPFWTDEVFYPGSEFETIAYLGFQMTTKTTEMARLSVGFLIRDILDRFSSKIASKLSPDRSLWIYSAHDSTIANVLNALGLFEVNCQFIAIKIIIIFRIN